MSFYVLSREFLTQDIVYQGGIVHVHLAIFTVIKEILKSDYNYTVL